MVRPVSKCSYCPSPASIKAAAASCSDKVQRVWQRVTTYYRETADMSSTWWPRWTNFSLNLYQQELMPTEQFDDLERRHNGSELNEGEKKVYFAQVTLRSSRLYEKELLLNSELAPSLPSNRKWIEENWKLP
ncbi:MAG: hypothetical protein KGJ02_08250 [Verrucomicrobiota bacterium]|nr:hypothetical protein [Verrucomicrobiota bacterium]